MNSVPTLDIVIQALNALYRGDSAEGKEKANIWLGELQKSIYAWQVADQILLTSHDQDHCYFAAQTMRTKIQYHFNELPESSYESLKNSLITHCSKIIDATPHSITTQLSLALADFALQLTTWNYPTKELLEQYASDSSKWRFLLEFMIVFPEEVNSKVLRLGKNRKLQVITQLSDTSDMFLAFLLMLHQEKGSEETFFQLIIQCMGSWLSEITPTYMSTSFITLLALPFTVLKDGKTKLQLHKAASDCVCAALVAVEEYQKNPPLAEYLLVEVFKLYESYMNISQTDQYSEKGSNFSRIFAENAETFLPAILARNDPILSDIRSIELILICLNNPNYEVADVTFTFWNRLIEKIYDNKSLQEPFLPHFKQLLISLAKLCRFEHDTMDGIPDESSDDFIDFRDQCLELVGDITPILGVSTIFSELMQVMRMGNDCWETIEAALFLMCAAAKQILQDEQTNASVIEEACKSVLQVNTAHLTLQHTSLKLIQELHNWFKLRPDYIYQVVVYTSNNINHPRLSLIASSTIEALAAECYQHMQAYLADLVQAVCNADGFNIPQDAINNLLKACGYIISGLPDIEVIKQVLQTICQPISHNLNQILLSDNCNFDHKNIFSNPGIWLDRYTSILRTITFKILSGNIHPCQDIITQQIWPSIEGCFIKYKHNVNVIEKACRATRFAVRCLGLYSLPLLPSLVKQIVDLFLGYRHSCCLYLGSILIDEYATASEQTTDTLMQMFQALLSVSFEIMNQPNGPQSHPDIVDDLYRLGNRMERRLPNLLVSNLTFRPLLRCAILSLNCDHKTAHESITKFIVGFIDMAAGKEKNMNANEQQLSSQILEDSGQDLVDSVIKAALFYLPKSLFEDLAEILYRLLTINQQIIGVWLQNSLNQLPKQRASATPQQLLEFHQSIIISSSIEEIEEALRIFSRLYR